MRKHWTVFLVAWMALLAATVAASQRDGSQLRTVHGAVVDKQDTPVASGVVYLKNLRTLTVKTYISDDNGQYRFSGLDPNVDYEIHAEYKGLTSANRTISSFETRKEIVINLKLDKKKTER